MTTTSYGRKLGLLAAILFCLTQISPAQVLELIPNPDNLSNSGTGFFGARVTSNGLVYARIRTISLGYEMHAFDGEAYTLIPNPPDHDLSSRGYQGHAIWYNGYVYGVYRSNSGILQLYRYDGSTLTAIPNPEGHNGNNSGVVGRLIVYNGVLYCAMRDDNEVLRMYAFDGNVYTQIPNPPEHTIYGYDNTGSYAPTIYNDKLYIRLRDDASVLQMWEFDGSAYTLIPNPPSHTGFLRGLVGGTLIADGKMYLRYQNNFGLFQLYTFDGSELSLIPNPPAHQAQNRGYNGDGIAYNGLRYFQYRNDNGNYQMYAFDPVSSEMTLVPNPPDHGNNFVGYMGNPIVKDGLLYLRYVRNDNLQQLYVYNGDSLSLIENPPLHTGNLRGYLGFPFEFNNNLYFRYQNNGNVSQMYKLAGEQPCETTFGTDVQEACESFTWIDGTTYTESNNMATFALMNAAGCDSLVTLNLSVLEPSFGTDNKQVCFGESLTWIDGITYSESNSTATFTLENAAGCDSLVTLNLSILEPDFGTDVQDACFGESFTWIDGVVYTDNNNSATFVLENALGCDSTVTLDLSFLKIDTHIDLNWDVFEATPEADSYQWINCDTGEEIEGATEAQFMVPDFFTNYAVMLTQGSCTVTSECVAVIINSASGRQVKNPIRVWPNPAEDHITLESGAAITGLRVMSMQQSVVYEWRGAPSEELRVDLSGNAAGLYMIFIETAEGSQTRMVIKK